MADRTTQQRRRRRVRPLLLLLAAVGLGVGVALPIWFPWVLRPVLRFNGVEYGSYTRVAQGRFLLRDVRGSWPGVGAAVEQLEVDLPTRWLWRWLRSDTNGVAFATARNWRLHVAEGPPSPDPGGSAEPASVPAFEVLDQLARLTTRLGRWAPLITAREGTIRLLKRRFEVPTAHWEGGRFVAGVRAEGAAGGWQLAADASDTGRLVVSVLAPELDASTRVRLSRGAAQWVVEGEVLWATNRGVLTGRCRPTSHGLTLQLRADPLRVPAERLRLPDYREWVGTFTAGWNSNRLAIEASGRAEPRPDAVMALPPVELRLRAQGDLESVQLDAFRVVLPWGEAELLRPLTLARGRHWAAQSTTLQATVDLERLPGLQLAGIVSGSLHVTGGESQPPSVRFNLTADGARWQGLEARSAALLGRVDWPRLTLQRGTVELEDGARLEAAGEGNLLAQSVDTLRWTLQGSGHSLFRRVPWTCDGWSGSGEIHGPRTNLVHSADVRVTNIALPSLRPATAHVSWQGQGTRLEEVAVDWVAGDARLQVAGALEVQHGATPGARLALQELALSQGSAALYRLHHPTTLILAPAVTTNEHGSRWAATIEDLHWEGDGRRIGATGQLQWPGQGRLQLLATNWDLAAVAPFLDRPLPRVALRQLDLQAQWSNGPVRLNLRLDGSADLPGAPALRVNGSVAADAAGTRVAALEVDTPAYPAVRVDGTLPLTWAPGDTNAPWRLDRMGAWDLAVRTVSSPPVNFDLGGPGRMECRAPRAHLGLRGSLDEPQVRIEASLQSLVWTAAEAGQPRPRLEDVHLEARFEDQRLSVDSLTARLDGQAARAQAQWPVPDDFWSRLAAGPASPDWRTLEGRLQVDEGYVAALSRYLPDLIGPVGRWHLDLRLAPGAQLAGTLAVTGAATRPLGSLPPIRDLGLRLAFHGREARLESCQGLWGVQPVQLGGRFDLPTNGPASYQLTLTGTNVPLARSAGWLLRSDLALSLAGTNREPPRLAGTVRLRDGLFVQNVTHLLRQGPERLGASPPYFSVTNAPFAEWRLAVDVQGDRFLRVRTPVFQGLLSADFQLAGTLARPEAVGDARIQDGHIRFPFGTLEVDRGFASLSGNDPQGPTLDLQASGRNFRYLVRLEVRGPAETPDILFTATPPLTSEEILLMLTAGEVPRDDYVFSNQAKAGRIASFVGKDLVSRLLGNEASGDRLVVQTGEHITESGKTTYALEYRLTDRWSIVGEWDRFDALNAGVKWRLLSR